MDSHILKSPKMKTYAIFEAKNRLSELVAAAQSGEEITITRRGAPVARLVAMDSGNIPLEGQAQTVQAQMQILAAVGNAISPDLDVKNAIQTGRD
jgi:prevent-host-death family protein